MKTLGLSCFRLRLGFHHAILPLRMGFYAKLEGDTLAEKRGFCPPIPPWGGNHTLFDSLVPNMHTGYKLAWEGGT